jgi:hypothetical protein
VQGLFNDGSIRDWLRGHLEELERAVKAIPPDVVGRADLEQLSEELASRHQVQAPSLLESNITQRQTETTVEVHRDSHLAFEYSAGAILPAIRLDILVPVRGEKALLRCIPASQIFLRHVEGKVVGDTIVFTHTYAVSKAEGVPTTVEDWLRGLREKVQVIANEIEAHNRQLNGVARSLLSKRRTALGTSKEVSQALGYPLHKREDTPEVYALPLARKALATEALVGSADKANPQWMIRDQDYEEILSIFAAMSMSMERMPKAFAHLGEEDIRAFFLVYLNAHYRGTATGETFNAAGKTDILVQVEGRTVFIAECKIWKGGEAFTEALDQLLSYLTWRDTKTALAIFNRNKNLRAVLKQIPGLVTSHPAFSGGSGQLGETRFRYLLRHPTDTSRTLIVSVLVFDVPSESTSATGGS